MFRRLLLLLLPYWYDTKTLHLVCTAYNRGYVAGVRREKHKTPPKISKRQQAHTRTYLRTRFSPRKLRISTVFPVMETLMGKWA